MGIEHAEHTTTTPLGSVTISHFWSMVLGVTVTRVAYKMTLSVFLERERDIQLLLSLTSLITLSSNTNLIVGRTIIKNAPNLV